MSELAEYLFASLVEAELRASTEATDALIGDVENWKPIGILAALESGRTET
jgi:hypothetical protein